MGNSVQSVISLLIPVNIKPHETLLAIAELLQPDAARVSKALHDGLGAMPSFKETLTEEEIAALALYVSKASRLP